MGITVETPPIRLEFYSKLSALWSMRDKLKKELDKPKVTIDDYGNTVYTYPSGKVEVHGPPAEE